MNTTHMKSYGRAIARAGSHRIFAAEARFAPRAVHEVALIQAFLRVLFSPVNAIPLMIHIRSCIIWGRHVKLTARFSS
jgi:hypothetical protein